MKKKPAIKNVNQGKVSIFIGFLLIFLSLFSAPIISYISTAVCPKDSFGQCTLGSSLTAGTIYLFLPYISVTLAIALIVYGIVKINRLK